MKVLQYIADDFESNNINTGRKLHYSFYNNSNIGEAEIYDRFHHVESSIVLAKLSDLYTWIQDHI